MPKIQPVFIFAHMQGNHVARVDEVESYKLFKSFKPFKAIGSLSLSFGEPCYAKS